MRMSENRWATILEETNDGSGDLVLTFPDQLLEEKGWKEGTILNIEIEKSLTGNVLVITEVKK